ncbi:hypothetical protein [Streptomyces tsukubensis]|uniref:hypothetical protein n=1 Tax=Streptomyces tsukubensis TaxID=83656 RepID=UPI00344FE247
MNSNALRVCDVSRALNRALDPERFPRALDGWTILPQTDSRRVEIALNFMGSTTDRAMVEIIRARYGARYIVEYTGVLDDDEYEVLPGELRGCALLTLSRCPEPAPRPASDMITVSVPEAFAAEWSRWREDADEDADWLAITEAWMAAPARRFGRGRAYMLTLPRPLAADYAWWVDKLVKALGGEGSSDPATHAAYVGGSKVLARLAALDITAE